LVRPTYGDELWQFDIENRLQSTNDLVVYGKKSARLREFQQARRRIKQAPESSNLFQKIRRLTCVQSADQSITKNVTEAHCLYTCLPEEEDSAYYVRCEGAYPL